MPDGDPLDRLVEAVLASPKYRHISPALVRRLGAQELGKGRRLKEAVKAAKSKLHQVGGAYFRERADYAAWLADLRAAARSPQPQAFREACVRAMAAHASTRERLPILESFYQRTLAGLPPLRSVLDAACGLNPLALPWMPLADGARYYACDIYSDLVDFLNGYLALLPVGGRAWVCDVAGAPPSQRADLALVLKTIPCLEQVDKDAGERLLEGLNAAYLLVSFPLSSLGGREKGMAENYEARFNHLTGGKGWEVERFEFESELAFLVRK